MGVIGSQKNVFSNGLTYVDRNNKILSQILTTFNKPVFNRSTLVDDQNYLLQHKVSELMNTGCLRQSDSPFSSPVYVQYIGDKIELAVDYSMLNDHTISRNYSFPSQQQILLSINESSIFSKIILKDAYHQLALTHDSMGKTAFATSEFVRFTRSIRFKF